MSDRQRMRSVQSGGLRRDKNETHSEQFHPDVGSCCVNVASSQMEIDKLPSEVCPSKRFNL